MTRRAIPHPVLWKFCTTGYVSSRVSESIDPTNTGRGKHNSRYRDDRGRIWSKSAKNDKNAGELLGPYYHPFVELRSQLNFLRVPLGLLWSSSSQILGAALTPQVALCEQQQQQYDTSSRNKNNKHKTTATKDYDFVIVGNGITGRTAMKHLQKECPHASIALIDPLRPYSSANSSRRSNSTGSAADENNKKQTDYYASWVLGFDPGSKVVQLSSSGNNNISSSSSESTAIRYKHAILLATGARGAPIPQYLIDEDIQDLLFELRPTTLPVTTQETTTSENHNHNDNNNNDGENKTIIAATSGNNNDENSSDSNEQSCRPVLPSEDVRSFTINASRRGYQVAVLGSGWEAVELVAAAAMNRNSARKVEPILIFGGKGPLSHALPNYLSAEVSKRLKKNGIRVLDRSVIRYVEGEKRNNKETLEIHTAKAYDLLDTSRYAVNFVVAAPEIKGHMGTAVLPTNNIPQFLKSTNTIIGVPSPSWYQTWSHLTMDLEKFGQHSVVACYSDDGRIAVNAELCAGTGVYAAGSTSKYPNIYTGHAEVAGLGYEDGKQAGYVAAMNMSREYHEDQRSTFFGLARQSKVKTRLLKDPIPVWRSDVFSSYLSSPATSDDNEKKRNTKSRKHTKKRRMSSSSHLGELGIRALCVGNCDSETCSTHALWWTNQAAQQRVRNLLRKEEEEYSSLQGDVDTAQQQRRKTGRGRKRKMTEFSAIKPVYGFGVVFYFGVNGRIQGVMTWGLPFSTTTTDSEQNSSLNTALVERMKKVITNTDEICSHADSTETNRNRLFKYLEDESRMIVALAFRGRTDDGASHQLDVARIEEFPRTLQRVTEVRPPEERSVRVLKRPDGQGHGLLGEDLFSQRESVLNEKESMTLPRLEQSSYDDYLQGQHSGNNKEAAKAEAFHNFNLWRHIERYWEENDCRARPPKEENLWVRKGDENKSITQKDRWRQAFWKAILTGPQ